MRLWKQGLQAATALAFAATGSFAAAADAGPTAAELQHAHDVLGKTILIDGHNDLPWAIRQDATAKGDVSKYDLRGKVPGHTDIARLRAGGVGA